ncbi:MAG TPA: DUF255 domain-containing protein [Saprospiraceae bacterium]|nr:DUF255 domain-containing protein [Saprospiraceae bacterium]
MRSILILLSVVFLAGCVSTSKKTDESTTKVVEKKETKTVPAVVVDDKEIHWMSLEEAVKKQKENPKKIFMDAYTKWCGPCKMLDKNTFHDPNVVKYVNEHYYGVKFDAEAPDPIFFKGKEYKNPNYVEGKRGRNGVHELAIALGVRAYPTMLFLDENANFILPVTGYLKPNQLEIYLKLVAQNDYKNIKSKEEWEAYQKKFTPTF